MSAAVGMERTQVPLYTESVGSMGAKNDDFVTDEPKSLTLKDVALALTVANVMLFRVWWELLTYGPTDMFVMKATPAPAAYLIAIVNVIVLAFLLSGAVFIFRRYAGRNAAALIEITFAVSLVFPAMALLGKWSTRHPGLRNQMIRTLGQEGTSIIAFAVLLGGIYMLGRNGRIGGAAILLPFVPITFGQALWKASTYDEHKLADEPIAGWLPVKSGSPHVIWIIFDRLDQRLTFVDRPAGLALREFDRLKQESVYGSNAFPPSSYTIMSMPALITGRLVAAARPDDGNSVFIRHHQADRGVKWMPAEDSLFSEARAAKWNAGIVGWYFPYCRTMNQSLSACEWFEMARQHNSYDAPPNLPNWRPPVTAQLRSLLETDALSPFGQSLTTQKHAATYDAIVSTARKAVTDSRLNLLLLHLPAPHGPFFYNRKTKRYDLQNSPPRGYIDHLALTDATLGALRQELEAASMWDNTTLLVSADHSNGNSQLLDGQHNPRVPFLLKMAGQKAPVELSTSFNTVLTKQLLLDILKGKVQGPKDVGPWVEQHKSGITHSPYDH